MRWYKTIWLMKVAREIQIHSTLHHEHIIALYGSFEDAKHVYLVQEFAVGAALSWDTQSRPMQRIAHRRTWMSWLFALVAVSWSCYFSRRQTHALRTMLVVCEDMVCMCS